MAFALTGPDSIILNQGESTPVILQIVKAAKPWRNVGLTVSGLPNGVTAEFFPSNGKPSFNSTMTLRSAANSVTGTFTIIVTARDARSSQSMPIIFSNYQPPNVPGPIPPPAAPVLTTLSPSSITEDTGAFTLTVNGTGFASGATVFWNGSSRTTTFNGATQLLAAILAGDITTPGTASVTATNPGSSSSNALTFTINAAGGATYDFYVNPSTGSDSNDGTAPTVGGGHGPWATFGKASSTLVAGQSCGFADGTYVGEFSAGGAATSSNRKTFASINKWGAVLDGQNTNNQGVGLDSYCTLDGFEIKNYLSTTEGTGAGGVDMSGGGGVTGAIVRNCKIHAIGKASMANSAGQSGIYIEGGTNITIEKNVFYDIGRLRPGDPGYTATNNYYMNHDHGIYVRGSTNLVIKNNVFYQNDNGWSVQFDGVSSSGPKIYNNTFADPNPDRDAHIVVYVSVSSLDIANNISYNPSAAIVEWNTGGTFSGNVRNNCTTASMVGTNGGGSTYTPSGVTYTSNQLSSTTILFVDASARNYRLTSSASDPIDSGVTLTTDVPDDFDGTTRPVGGAYDIGAFESF